MNTLITILSVLVALVFLYILYLETFATTSDATAKTFSLSPSDLKNDKVQTLLKNQGIYNGLIAIGIIYTLFFTSNYYHNLLAIMIYIILVALYGTLSSGNKTIIVKQGGLPIIVTILLLMS
ncbi:membrane protein [Leuconostoc mesenteroides P45]|uniref:DUF1304 domain-containing protein n=1 Tax=Leuconostoc mesenteroides TaxID=1245 RepID=UPI00050692DA|nr:DUF1304 family protein [Leuconostoc mesenteroides]KGB49735.1 membrane protein [Leuconostoc mesenteroides P45]